MGHYSWPVITSPLSDEDQWASSVNSFFDLGAFVARAWRKTVVGSHSEKLILYILGLLF